MVLVAFLEYEAAEIAGFTRRFYMDSNNSLSAMTRGDSNTAAIVFLVARDWELIHRFHIRDWFPRVPPKLIPADLPTRWRMSPFRAEQRRSYRPISQLYRACRDVARRQTPRAKARALRLRFRFPPVPLARNIYPIRRNDE